jgi:hypothetical protein
MAPPGKLGRAHGGCHSTVGFAQVMDQGGLVEPGHTGSCAHLRPFVDEGNLSHLRIDCGSVFINRPQATDGV